MSPYEPWPSILICDSWKYWAKVYLFVSFWEEHNSIGTTNFSFLYELPKSYVQWHICPGSLIIGSLEQILQREGVRGMYRGLSPTVLALLPNWAVSSFASNHFRITKFCLFFISSYNTTIVVFCLGGKYTQVLENCNC